MSLCNLFMVAIFFLLKCAQTLCLSADPLKDQHKRTFAKMNDPPTPFRLI